MLVPTYLVSNTSLLSFILVAYQFHKFQGIYDEKIYELRTDTFR